MSLHRKMIILRLLHPRHIVQPIHKIHRRMYLRDRTVLSVCSRQIRCRNSLLLFGKPPQYHCLNIFPMVSNQEFEHCQYSHHYSFHHSWQEQKSLSKLSENRIKFSYSFFDTSYEFRFIPARRSSGHPGAARRLLRRLHRWRTARGCRPSASAAGRRRPRRD